MLYGFILTWLFLSYHLTRQPGIAFVMSRYARVVFPFVLIWLGYRILSESDSLKLFHPGG